MYRNLYIDINDDRRWYYYRREKFETRKKALSHAKKFMDFRITYRKTIKLSEEGITTVLNQGRYYVDKSLFQ